MRVSPARTAEKDGNYVEKQTYWDKSLDSVTLIRYILPML
jgi:hypothetical protein